jgi:DNA-binding response OmpR family regulator
MKRILIVEDEAKLARLISRVLGEEGYAVETTGDGRSGLARVLLVGSLLNRDRSALMAG